MDVSTALEAEMAALRRAEAVRLEEKAAAFKEAFAGSSSRVELLNGVEFVVVDDYVFYETYAEAQGSFVTHSGPRYSRMDGQGYGEYMPGKRFLVYMSHVGGDFEGGHVRVQDIKELARISLLFPHKLEFDTHPDLVLPVLLGVPDLARHIDEDMLL